MKKFLIFILTLTLFMTTSSLAFAETKYFNSTFDSSLTGWTVNKDDSETLEWACESIGFLRWNGFVHMKTDNSCYMQRNVTGLIEGDLLTFSFDLKAVSFELSGSAEITLDFFGDDNSYVGTKRVGYKDVSDEFINHEFDFIVPERATRVNILVRAYSGEIYCDNIILADTYNQSDLSLKNGGLDLPHLPNDVKTIAAKLHYVPTKSTESINLILAEYTENDNGYKELNDVKILPLNGSNKITEELLIDVTNDTTEVSAYVWKNDNTLVPLMEKEMVTRNDDSSVYNIFAADKIRAVYGGLSMIYDKENDFMSNALEAGCNTFILNLIGNYYNGDVNKDQVALGKVCADLSDYADETGAHIFVKGSFGANSVVNNTSYGAYSPGAQNTLSLPCPLSEQYWEEEMLSRFQIVASYPKIAGVVFDMEMYSGGTTRYATPCFCSSCVAAYSEENPSKGATSLLNTDVNSRRQYAINNGLYGGYNEWFSEKVTELTSKMRDELHKTNPDLIIGYMPELEWLPGITKGLGTDERPVVVFNEQEYKGTLAQSYTNLSEIKLNDYPAVYCVGLWTDEAQAISAENISGKVVEAGKRNIGYFIYGLPGVKNMDSYLAGIKSGNSLLDEYFKLSE